MIDKKYQDIIAQCEKRVNELNAWEQSFILGDPNDPRKVPMRDRQYLSTAQKQKLDQIVVTRFEGGKWSEKNVQVEFGDVNAERTNEGWVVYVAGYPIGAGMARKEVPIITAFLHAALPALLQIPGKALRNYLNGDGTKPLNEDTEEQVTKPETEEDPF